LVEDIAENVEKRVKATHLSKDQANIIELREFEIRTFKLTKA
jgi:hypothetical protein